MKRLLYTLAFTICLSTAFAQIVNIPDANFKNALLNSNCATLNGNSTLTDVDTNNDGEIQVTEALAVDSLFVDNRNLTSLEGITSFTNLQRLKCDHNQLTTLDVHELTNLKKLDCSYNQLTTLNVQGLTNLQKLSCYDNQLTTLNVQGLTNLQTLLCYNNQLTTLNVQALTNLRYLYCYNNQLTTLDVQGLTNLQDLRCYNNQLTTLNVQALTNLRYLYCYNNQLTTLDVQGLTNLQYLYCAFNQLTTLDVQALTNLRYLDCYNNQISTLDVQVLTNLISLYCGDNNLTTLDVQALTNLLFLDFSYNQLTTLDVQGLTNLNDLKCTANQLTTLDVQGLTNLQILYCETNQLTTLNVQGLTNLNDLKCNANQLTTLDVQGLTNLQNLICQTNQLATLNVQGLTNLQTLYCGSNNLTTLDVQGCSNLQTLSCYNNQLTTLDVQGCPNLQQLFCQQNQLRTLFIKNGRDEYIYFSNNPNLQFICADENQIQSIQNTCNNNGYNTLVSSYCSFAPGGNNNTVKGNIQYDFDNNGCDANDINADAISISISDATNFGTVFTNTQGNFEFYTNSLNVNLTPNLTNNYFTISPNVANITFPDDSNRVAIQNFCLTPNGVHNDVEVTLIPITTALPGFQALYKILYRNKGTQIMQGNIAFHFNEDFLDYVNASQTPSSMNAGMLNFDYTNLLPFESREYTITMRVHTPMDNLPVNGGDILRFTTTVTPIQNDETPLDNTFELNQLVVNSFDPNDKTCIQGDKIDITQVGDYLHYVIRFENTGTAEAINIVVVDTIDVTKFDISTLVPISASHSYITRIKNNKVEFIFENINLPFDDANNDGYAAFKIKTKSNLTLNTNIQNRASIYFDYNFPIVTNRTSTVVSNLTSIENINKEIFVAISPNPAKDIAQIQCSEPIVSLSISDLSGKTLQQISSKNNIKSLAIANLSKGVYFVKINTNKGFKVLRLLKE